MAEAVRRKRPVYESYGNVAYDPAYSPRRDEREGVEERPVIRRRERVRSRARVMVRPAGYVAPGAVIGFALVAVMAVLILMCCVNVTVASAQVVSLRKESTQLQEAHSKLLTEYELAYDLKTVEEVATTRGGMVQPQAGQQVTMDLSEPDSALIHTAKSDPFAALWNEIRETGENIVSFFR